MEEKTLITLKAALGMYTFHNILVKPKFRMNKHKNKLKVCIVIKFKRILVNVAYL